MLLYQKIAEQIREDIHREGLDRLLSLRELATKYAVSLETVGKAIHILRDSNEIEVSRGKGILVVGKDGSVPKVPTSTSRYVSGLKRQIREGIFRPGQNLPPIKKLAESERLTENTVCAAFIILRDEGALYKAGKRWIVGSVPAGGDIDGPAVLILADTPSQWKQMSEGKSSSLISPLLGGLASQGLTHVMLYCRRDDQSGKTGFGGDKIIAGLLKSLGNNYNGAYICVDPGTSEFAKQCVSALLAAAQPVVWFAVHGA